MENVKIIDDLVTKIRSIISKTADKKFVPLSVEDLLSVLQSCERLAALERHLYNLTSNSYKLYA